MNESVVRTISGIIYIALLLAATLFSGLTFISLFGIFMFIAVIEFCRLVNLNSLIPLIMSAFGYVVFAVFGINDTYSNLLLNLAALFVSLLLINDLFKTGPLLPKEALRKYVVLVGYIIIPYLLLIKLPFLNGGYNPHIVIGSFVLIWANDTFAYIVGKTMGKRKLFERISPKKTVEGFLGGMVFTIIAAYILSIYYTFLPAYHWMIIAVILVIAGTFGDLVESHLKRNAGVKDSGKIMPGHGGILDRQDSIIFAIPFLFLFYQIMNYVS